jgi:hypothetical protein
MRKIVVITAAIAALSVSATDADSQQSSLSPSVTRCFEQLSPKAMNWTPVHLDAVALDKRFQSSADLLVARIANRVITRFGAAEGGTPSLDSMLNWRDLNPDLIVFASRDGTLRWTADTTGEQTLLARGLPQSAAMRLLDTALVEIVRTREGLVWPDGNVPNVAVLRLTFRYAQTDRDGNLRTNASGTPIFSLMIPWEQAGALKVIKKAEYPTRALNAGVRGEILVRYRVNEDGRAVDIQDIPPQDIPENLAAAYRELADEAMRSVKGSTFEPRRIGGCAAPYYARLRFSLPVLPSGPVRR